METQKIVNLLNDIKNKNSKFATKNGMLLIVNQKVIIHMKIQSNFEQIHENQFFVIILIYFIVTGNITVTRTIAVPAGSPGGTEPQRKQVLLKLHK